MFTGADIAETQGTLPCAWPVTEDMVHPNHPPLAVDEVRHAGEPVAVVVARSAAAAVDALDAIDVDYETLPVVLDMEAAIARRRRRWSTPTRARTRATPGSSTRPRPAPAAAPTTRSPNAEVVVKRRYKQQRLIPAFMEPRSVVVDPTGDQVTIWSATQIPHILRFLMALLTGTPEQKVRVIAPDVGGGFGGKLQVTAEEMLTFFAAQRVGKPVKYTETRSDSLLCRAPRPRPDPGHSSRRRTATARSSGCG